MSRIHPPRIRTTRQARRLRHKAEIIMAKHRVDALHAEWFWAAVAAAATQLDNWAVGRAAQIQRERVEVAERAEIERGDS